MKEKEGRKERKGVGVGGTRERKERRIEGKR